MFIWITQISILSIIFIFLIHHLILFFKSTLTVPKIKDLVNTPNQKYQHIYDTISHNSYTNLDLLPTEPISNEPNNMKNELKTFLKKQLNNDTNNDNNNNEYIMGMESLSNNTFSNYQ